MRKALLDGNFKTVDNSSLVDRVEANLVELLQLRKLKVGDAIPKEIELAEIVGVSRTVVREALLRLRVMGLIESKKKKGSIITSPDLFAVISKSMNPYILDEETLREMFELRLVLEIGMADLLFHRIKKSDIDELYEIASTNPASSSQQFFDIEYEIAFHGKLYEISGNQTMKKFQRLLLPIFEYVHRSELLKSPSPLTGFVSHNELVQILEHGNPEKFREGMRKHLENHFRRLFS